MTEKLDGPHSTSPVEAQWLYGNWIVRQNGLAFGFEYSGRGGLTEIDKRDQLAIILEISIACLTATPDPMTEEGLSNLQTKVRDFLTEGGWKEQ